MWAAAVCCCRSTGGVAPWSELEARCAARVNGGLACLRVEPSSWSRCRPRGTGARRRCLQGAADGSSEGGGGGGQARRDGPASTTTRPAQEGDEAEAREGHGYAPLGERERAGLPARHHTRPEAAPITPRQGEPEEGRGHGGPHRPAAPLWSGRGAAAPSGARATIHQDDGARAGRGVDLWAAARHVRQGRQAQGEEERAHRPGPSPTLLCHPHPRRSVAVLRRPGRRRRQRA